MRPFCQMKINKVWCKVNGSWKQSLTLVSLWNFWFSIRICCLTFCVPGITSRSPLLFQATRMEFAWYGLSSEGRDVVLREEGYRLPCKSVRLFSGMSKFSNVQIVKSIKTVWNRIFYHSTQCERTSFHQFRIFMAFRGCNFFLQFGMLMKISTFMTKHDCDVCMNKQQYSHRLVQKSGLSFSNFADDFYLHQSTYFM